MLVMILACTPESLETGAPNGGLLDPTTEGPYGVGRDTVTIDDDRGGTLTLDVWYPATVSGEPDAYAPTVFTGLAHLSAPRMAGTFPLVVFSHGNGGLRFQSFFLTEWLASHGFVVAAPDHPHNTAFDYDDDLTAEVMARRPGDVARAADYAMSTYDTEERYLVMGHSFGGWTTLAVAGGALDLDWMRAWCEAGGEGEMCGIDTPTGPVLDQPDPRAYGGVAMAPCGWYSFGDTGLAAETGVAVMAGERDQTCPLATEAQPTVDRLGDPTALYTVPNGGHFVFSIMCDLGPIMEECGDDSYATTEEAQPGIAHWATAWALRRWSDDSAYDAWL